MFNACPSPLEFSVLFSRILSGDSSTLDMRNNLQLCGNSESGFVIVNRNGCFVRIDNKIAENESQLYFAVVNALCAESNGVQYNGELPEYDHFLGKWV